MMIPYPSSSSAPSNVTVVQAPQDITGMVIGGTAIGALGIGSAFLLYQYLKPKKNQEQEQTIVLVEEVEPVIVVPQGDGLAHICVNPSELEEIKQILMKHRKAFRVIF
jgi:hypothetical protein